MKYFIAYCFSLLLLIVLFVSTTGFSIVSQLCLMTGEKTISIDKPSDCCEMDGMSNASFNFNSTDCCQTNSSFIKLCFNGYQQNQPNHNELPLSFTVNLPSISYFNYFASYLTNSYKYFLPPKDGKSLLVFNSTFRI